MSDNKTMTTELRLKVVSDGLDKLSHELKNLGVADKQIEPLLKAIAGLQASSEVIQTLEKSGAVYSLKRYIDGLENEMNRLNKIKFPEIPTMDGIRNITKKDRSSIEKYAVPFSRDAYIQSTMGDGRYEDMYNRIYKNVRQKYPTDTKAFDNVARERALELYQVELERTLKKAESFHNSQNEKLKRFTERDEKLYQERLRTFEKNFDSQVKNFNRLIKVVGQNVEEIGRALNKVSADSLKVARAQPKHITDKDYVSSTKQELHRLANVQMPTRPEEKDFQFKTVAQYVAAHQDTASPRRVLADAKTHSYEGQLAKYEEKMQIIANYFDRVGAKIVNLQESINDAESNIHRYERTIPTSGRQLEQAILRSEADKEKQLQQYEAEYMREQERKFQESKRVERHGIEKQEMSRRIPPVSGLDEINKHRQGLDVSALETEVKTRQALLDNLTKEAQEKARLVLLTKDEVELTERLKEYREALNAKFMQSKYVDDGKADVARAKEELAALKSQEKLQNQREIFQLQQEQLNEQQLVNAAQEGNVDAVSREVGLREQIVKLANLDVKEAEQAVGAAKDREQAEAALLKHKEALEAQTNANQSVQNAREQLKIAQDTNKEIEKRLKIETEIESAKSKADSIVQSISSDKLKVSDVQFKLREINAELAKMPASVREIEASRLADDLRKAGVHTKQLGGHLEFVSAKSNTIESHIAKTVREMFSLEKLVSRISFVITAKLSYEMFDKVIAGFKSAIMTNIQFRDEMGKTFALIVGESDAVKETLAQNVIAIAGRYRVDLKEASEGIYTIISAQFQAADAVKVLDAAMKLAVGGFANLNDAALSLVQTLNAFELGAEQASHVADVMFETTRLGIITTEQYASEMSKVASTAAIFGISIEEVSAAISVMTRNGVKVSQAFTSLNQLLMTIANPTTQAKELMSSYGKELSISDVRAKGLVGTLMELQPLLQSEEDSTVIFKSRTGFKAMASLVQNADDYINDLIAMYDSVGASQEATNERLQTTASLMKEVGITARNFGMTIGKSFEPTMRDIYRGLNDLMKTFIKVFPYILSALKGIAVQIAVMKIPALFKAIGSGVQSLRLSFMYMMDGLKNAINGTAVSAKAAIAEATAGISLIIGLIIQVVSALVTAGKEAAKARFDKAMGLHEAEEGLITIQGEIDNLNSKISSIDGILKLIEQTDELGKNVKGNIDLLGHWEKQHYAVANAIAKVLDVEIDKVLETGKLGDWHNRLIAARIENIRKAIMAELQFQQLSLGKDMSQMVKDTGAYSASGSSLGFSFGRIGKDLLNALPIIGKPIEGSRELLQQTDAHYNLATSRLYKISKQVKDVLDDAAYSGGELSNAQINLLNARKSEAQTAYSDYKKVLGEINLDFATQKDIEKLNKVSDALLTIPNTIDTVINSAEQAKINIALAEVPAIPDLDRGKGTGKGGGAGGAQKQIQDSVDQFIGKFVAMFARVGFEAETQFMRDIQDLLKDIEEYNKKTNTVKIGKEIINTLELTAGQIGQFAEFNELVGKRILDPSKILPNKAEIDRIIDAVKSSRADFQKAADALTKTGVPALMQVAEELMDDFDENLANAELTAYNYIEETAQKLIKKAKTPKEALEIMEKILKESYPDLFAKLAESSFEQIEELIADEDTPKSIQPYLKNVITERKKNLVDAIKNLVDDTAGIMKGLEKYMDSFQSLFDEINVRFKRMGLPTDRLSEFVIALSQDDKKVSAEILQTWKKEMTPQQQQSIQQLAEERNQLELEKNNEIQSLRDFISDVKRASGIDADKLAKNKAEVAAILDEAGVSGDSTIDYEALFDNEHFKNKMENVYSGYKRQPGQSVEEYLHEILIKRGTPWGGWGGVRSAKTLDEKVRVMSQSSTFFGKGKGYIPMTAGLSGEDQQVVNELKDEISELERVLKIDDEYIKELEDELAEKLSEIELVDVPETPEQIIEYLEKYFKELLPAGFEAWAQQAKLDWLYGIIGEVGEQPMSNFFKMLKRSRDRVGENGETIKGTGEFGRFLTEHYDVKPMTIDEAWSMAQQKIMEVMTDAWKDYWQNQIKAAEDARTRLLEIEESREKMMLANANLSSEQRARIQERYEERKRKIQEESERKLAEIRKKQALSELAVSFAKGIAEIWIRTLATKGAALGIPEAAALTGLLTGIFAIQYAQIAKQTFAEGGYTGRSTLSRDRTGERPAGIVHEGELVIDRKTMDRNFYPLMSLYESLKNGLTFAQAISRQRAEYPGFGMSSAYNARMRESGMYAGGGLVTRPAMTAGEPINIAVDLNGVRVLDDVAISVLAEQGNRRRRIIRG